VIQSLFPIGSPFCPHNSIFVFQVYVYSELVNVFHIVITNLKCLFFWMDSLIFDGWWQIICSVAL